MVLPSVLHTKVDSILDEGIPMSDYSTIVSYIARRKSMMNIRVRPLRLKAPEQKSLTEAAG